MREDKKRNDNDVDNTDKNKIEELDRTVFSKTIQFKRLQKNILVNALDALPKFIWECIAEK